MAQEGRFRAAGLALWTDPEVTKDNFGESTDFGRAFTRDLFYTVNHHGLDCDHVDGSCCDCAPNYRDGLLGRATPP
jgi:hypothetical protein